MTDKGVDEMIEEMRRRFPDEPIPNRSDRRAMKAAERRSKRERRRKT